MAVAVVGCTLDGKKHYMEKFGEFVEVVEEHGSEFTNDDWQRADQQFRLYSDIYFEKYREELSDDDMQRVSHYIVLYKERRTAVEWEKILNSEF